jgi:plastocyanin
MPTPPRPSPSPSSPAATAASMRASTWASTWRGVRLGLAACVPLVLVACAGVVGAEADRAADTSPETTDVDLLVVTDGMAFVEAPASIAAGELTIALDNRDRAPHDVTIDGIGTVVSASRSEAAIGTTTLEPGTYVVWCDVGGHREAGMEFELVVTDP